MGIKRAITISIRMPSDLADEIEKLVDLVPFSNFSEKCRDLIKVGIEFSKHNPKKMTQKELDDMVKKVSTEIKDETFIGSLLSFSSEQKLAFATILQHDLEKEN